MPPAGEGRPTAGAPARCGRRLFYRTGSTGLANLSSVDDLIYRPFGSADDFERAKLQRWVKLAGTAAVVGGLAAYGAIRYYQYKQSSCLNVCIDMYLSLSD